MIQKSNTGTMFLDAHYTERIYLDLISLFCLCSMYLNFDMKQKVFRF